MDPIELLKRTKQQMQLLKQNKKLEDRINQLADSEEINAQKQTLQQLKQKQDISLDVVLAEIRADISKQQLEQLSKEFDKNVEQLKQLKRRVKYDRVEKKNEESYTFLKESPLFIKRKLELKKEKGHLHQLQMELSRIKGILCAYTLIEEDLKQIDCDHECSMEDRERSLNSD